MEWHCTNPTSMPFLPFPGSRPFANATIGWGPSNWGANLRVRWAEDPRTRQLSSRGDAGSFDYAKGFAERESLRSAQDDSWEGYV